MPYADDMAKEVGYSAAEYVGADAAMDGYQRPAFSLRNRLMRVVWSLCWALFYRLSPRPLHAWRSILLRLFGAEMGPHCHFYPSSKVWAPWNLVCGSHVTAGDAAEIYNPARIEFGSHAVVSQGAYVCGATHDFDDAAFPLLAYTMRIGAYAWICARACVAPGVNVGEGAVLGLASVASRDLDAWTVYAGAPAVKVKERKKVFTAGAP